jgi:coenzyme Q-binding protein COQ10
MPTHAERLVVPYTQDQIFDLIADVERYPEFLPWCVAARIRQRPAPNILIADLVIGYKVFRERFTSHVQLNRPERIDVRYYEGPFRYLNNHWILEPHGVDECVIDFYVDFEFKSRMLQKVIQTLFNEAVQRMVGAFEKRADALYGPHHAPAAASQKAASSR